MCAQYYKLNIGFSHNVIQQQCCTSFPKVKHKKFTLTLRSLWVLIKVSAWPREVSEVWVGYWQHLALSKWIHSLQRMPCYQLCKFSLKVGTKPHMEPNTWLLGHQVECCYGDGYLRNLAPNYNSCIVRSTQNSRHLPFKFATLRNTCIGTSSLKGEVDLTLVEVTYGNVGVAQ